MATTNKIGPRIEIEGEQQYRKQLSYIATETKKFASEVKSISSSMDKENTSLRKNAELKAKLNQTIESLNQRLEAQKDHLKKAEEAYSKSGVMTEQQVKHLNNLKKGIADTETQINSWQNKLKEVPSDLEQISINLDRVSGKIKDFSNKIGSVGKDLTTKITAPIVGLATIGVNYNASMEQYRIMLTTLTGSADEADRVITQLQQDASKSPFDTSSLVKANQYLLSTGEDADKARNMITYLGDAIAATGGSSNELDRMAANLQQIKNLGKASAVDIKQFANAGIDIYGLLADYMGVTTAEAKEMDVTYEALYGAFEKASSEGGKYFGAMEKQSESLTGQISNLKDNVAQLLGDLTTELMPVIKNIVQCMKEWVDRIKNLSPEQKKLITTIAKIAAVIGPALVVFGKVGTAIAGIVKAFSVVSGAMGTIAPIFVAIKAALVPIIAGIGTAVSTMIGPILLIGGAIGGLILIIKNWSTISEKLKQDWEDIKEVFKTLGTNLVNGAKNIFNSLKSIFSNLGKKIKSDFNNILNFGVNTWNNLKIATINKWNEVQTGLVTKVTEIRETIVTIFKNIKDAVVDYVEQLKRGVVEKISGIGTTITNAFSSVTEFFSGLATKAWTWGKDLVDNFTGGMNNNVDKVRRASRGVAEEVSRFLEFSEPEAGPLSDFHTSMPHMMQMMAKGINDNLYLVEDAVSNVARTISGGISNSQPNVNYGGVVINLNVPNGANARELVDQIEQELVNRINSERMVFSQ